MSDKADNDAKDKIQAWIEFSKTKDSDSSLVTWTKTIISHIDVHAASPSAPHPSVTFTFTVQPEHCNRMGNLHGGAAASLFDDLTSMPLALVARQGFWQYFGVSRTLNVTYLRPVPAGAEVFIECQILQIGKKMCALRGVMRRKSDGQILCVCDHNKVNTDPEVKL